MKADISLIESEIRRLVADYGIELVVLFGSQATGDIHSKSDIDIAIRSAKILRPSEIATLATRLSEKLKKAVDIVEIHSAPPTLLQQIFTKGVPLYENEPAAFSYARAYALALFMEAKPLRDMRRVSLEQFAASPAV